VVKADVQGSVEAVVQLVQQISSPSVNIKVGGWVGGGESHAGRRALLCRVDRKMGLPMLYTQGVTLVCSCE
jgi:hypothetical protein